MLKSSRYAVVLLPYLVLHLIYRKKAGDTASV